MYCSQFNVEIYLGRKGSMIVCKDSNEEIWFRFFGQSSFAEYSTVAESSVVNVSQMLQSDDELSLFAPLGCGFQTGMGAVVNVAKAGSQIRSCKTIIAVDRFPSRLELATTLRATHTVNTMIPDFDFQQAVRDISPTGVSVTIDTTGVGSLIEEALQSLSPMGKMVHRASTPPGYKPSLDITDLLTSGKTITGCIEGNRISNEMIQWYREGRFPIDKLVTYFPASEFGKALAKPALRWKE
ncbi:hypothetical protein BDW59DRAFT_164735 [Aspergillus cavernicola]|uniref:Alcohol dehydrogenase-like C-terminal domain-containing protein n=1 Tax=Aspergillus cavernicola TaxID=176166 RepID=A0ABR4HXN2_9EURO